MTSATEPRAPAAPTLTAPAKVNLTLHVTGQRADGYHLLDSLVVFANHGDRLTLARADDYTIRVSGPRSAGVPPDDRNLCMKAARLAGLPVSLLLEKHLPNEAGLGGGSSDAATVLRAIAQMTGQPVPDDIVRLGADLPVCLRARATRMQGVGEVLSDVPALPPLPAVLINPGLPVATPAVFRALTRRDNPGMDAIPGGLASPAQVAAWLATQRNDLESPAIAIAPAIAGVLGTITQTPGCLLARMSGSGATCFGLFATNDAANHAAAHISKAFPAWWVQPVTLS